jgi:hypothetical protein
MYLLLRDVGQQDVHARRRVVPAVLWCVTKKKGKQRSAAHIYLSLSIHTPNRFFLKKTKDPIPTAFTHQQNMHAQSTSVSGLKLGGAQHLS